MKCDFCSSERVLYRYPCDSFRFYDGRESIGDWAACFVCSDIIECDQPIELLSRSITTFRKIYGHSMPALSIDSLVELHKLFFMNRKGPRENVVS